MDLQHAPTLTARIRTEWFSNIRGDVLSGIVVALALIPEAIGFSIVAGVGPKVGLYASFCIAVVLALTGGWPAMISAATGAMALLMVSLVRDHRIKYLFAATILTGAIQSVFGLLKLGRHMKFVPKAVMVGFVNALAILILVAQLPHLLGAGAGVYLIVLVGLAIIYLFPLVTKVVPAPLLAIVALIVFTVISANPFPTVGDMGELPSTLPVFASGGRTLLSTLVAGVFLMVLLLVLGDVLRVIPMVALVAVMVMVSINTCDWRSLQDIATQSFSETFIVVATVALVVATSNLALGMIIGTLLASVFFARKVAQQTRVRSSYGEATRTRTYVIEGQVLLVSAEAFMDAIDTREAPDHLILDLSGPSVWDATAEQAFEDLTRRLEAKGTKVELIGVDTREQALMRQLRADHVRDEDGRNGGGAKTGA